MTAKEQKKDGKSGPAIGIDLGTTFCCLAIFHGKKNQIEIIPNEVGRSKTPSFISFPFPDDGTDPESDDDEPEFGDSAQDLARKNPRGTIFNIKRMLGRKLNDPTLQKDREFWPFDLIEVKDKGQDFRVQTGPTSSHTPIEMVTLLVKHLKQVAESHLGTSVSRAVVSVPAFFSPKMRGFITQACADEGLTVLQLVKEPIAAAIAYDLHKGKMLSNNPQDLTHLHRNCLIFDLGGGTFDLAVLTYQDNKVIKVKALGGENHLGGEDIDNNMVQYCIKQFKQQHNIDLAEDLSSKDPKKRMNAFKRLRRLKTECELQKKFLSQSQRQVITVESIIGSTSLTVPIKREQFDILNIEIYDRCLLAMEKIMKDSKTKKEEIDEIILVGGSSRIPKLQELISKSFGGKQVRRTIDADEAVAMGAAVLAYYIDNFEVSPLIIEEQQQAHEIPANFEKLALENESKIQKKAQVPEQPFKASTPEAKKVVQIAAEPKPNPNPNTMISPESRLVKPSLLEILDVGIYMNQISFEVGSYKQKFQELLSITPEIYFGETGIFVGDEARAQALHDKSKDRFFDIFKLVTSTEKEPIHKISLKIDGVEWNYALCSHQIISLFLHEALSYCGIRPGGKLSFTLPFEQNSIVVERLRKSAKLAGYPEIQILTTVITTSVATVVRSKCYKNGAKSNFPPKNVFVLDVDQDSFCIGVVIIRPVGIFRVSARRSDDLNECRDKDFMQTHATLFSGANILSKMKDQYKKVFEKAIDLLLVDLKNNNHVDTMVVSETTRKATLIIKIVEEILKSKIGAVEISSFVANPLLGAALCASSSASLGSGSVEEILPSSVSLTDAESNSLVLTTNFGGSFKKEEFCIFTKVKTYSVEFEKIRKGSGKFLVQLDQKIGKRGAIFEACRYEMTLEYKGQGGQGHGGQRDQEDCPENFEIKINYELDLDGMYTLKAEIDEGLPIKLRMRRRDKLSCNFACEGRGESVGELGKLVKFYRI